MPELLTLGHLKKMETKLDSLFELEVPGSDRLICEEIFRHLPGKRIAFRSQWGGAEVLVKLFLEKKILRLSKLD